MRERLNIRNIKLGLFTRYQIRFSSLGLIVVRAQTDLYAKFYNTVWGTDVYKRQQCGCRIMCNLTFGL